MLTWASSRTRGSGSTSTSTSNYPGNRSTNITTTTATTVSGSSQTPTSTTNNNKGVYSRQEHLDSYLNDSVLGRSTMKVSQGSKADDTYDTVFSTVSEDTLILRVHFPSSGASTKCPEMKLTGVVASHRWLDSIGRVTGFNPTSSDRAFRDSKLLLGHAVKQVVQEMQLNPPSVSKFTDAGLEKMQSKNKKKTTTSGSTSADSPPSYESYMNDSATGSGSFTTQASSQPVDLPLIPQHFPGLEGMDRDALDELLNNDVVFLDYCNNLPVSSELDQLVSEKYQEAEKLAAENMSRRAELQELHGSTAKLHEQLKATVEEFKILEKQQDALQEKPDKRILIRELTRAKRESFEESEKLADDWLDNGDKCADTMDSFCRTFLEKRKIHHLRAAKIQILSQQHQ